MALTIRTQDGQEIELQPRGQVSPEALQTLFTGRAPADAPQVVGPSGRQIQHSTFGGGVGGFRDSQTGRTLSPLTDDELVAIGAAERDPTTGQLVRPGTDNPMTAERGFDRGIAQREVARRSGSQLRLAEAAAKSRQEITNADRDATAALKAFRTGEISIGQLSQVQSSLEKEYGPETLIHSSAWRELSGAEGVFQEAKQEQIDRIAQQSGLPSSYFVWDDRSGRPVPDKDLIEARNTAVEMQERAAKPVIEARKNAEDAAIREYELRMKMLETERGRDPSPTEMGTFQAKAIMLNQSLNERLSQIRGQAQQRAEGIVERAGGQVGQVPPATHPKLPTGASISGTFSSIEEAQSAGLPNKSYAVVAGHLVRKTIDGRWVGVQ